MTRGFRITLCIVASGLAALGSSADALHSAMLRFQQALDESVDAQSSRLSSVFCPSESLDYTDLLSSAQFAFKRGDYESSRACYSRALRRYWQDYDASIRPGLIEATSGNLARMQADTLRMRDALEHLTEQMPAAGALPPGSSERETNVHYKHYEREHRLPGQHAAPPGSVPLGAASVATAVEKAPAVPLVAEAAVQHPPSVQSVGSRMSDVATTASSPRLADGSIDSPAAARVVAEDGIGAEEAVGDATTRLRREQLHTLAVQALQLAKAHRASQRAGGQRRSGGQQRQLEPA